MSLRERSWLRRQWLLRQRRNVFAIRKCFVYPFFKRGLSGVARWFFAHIAEAPEACCWRLTRTTYKKDSEAFPMPRCRFLARCHLLPTTLCGYRNWTTLARFRPLEA